MTSLKKAIELRKQNWPTSILNNHPQKNISLFAIDPNGNELYLMFTGLIEPQVISFFGWKQESVMIIVGGQVASYGSAQ